MKKARLLYGNGVTIVPNVHAVMAWAAREWPPTRDKP